MIFASRPHYAAHLAPVAIGDLDVALVASYNDVVLARKAGHRRIVRMHHGIGQSYSDRNPSLAGGADHDDVGLFLVPNEHAASRWLGAYPAARVEVVGCPRLDDLPQRVLDGKTTVAVTFHWWTGPVPEARHTFRHYRDAIVALSKVYHVIGHGHPRATWLPSFYAKHGIEWVPSFDEVCRRADALIFDNTSAGFEFASTGRPVVLLDGPGYRRGVEHGLRFWAASGVGIHVNDSGLIPAVERALRCLPDDVAAREAALDIVYKYRTGAAQRVRDAIEEWAS